MDNKDKLSRAAEIMGHAGKEKEALGSDNPLYLSLLALRDVILTLADDENEAFTQLNVGGGWLRKFYLEDETKMFAQAIHFAEHPYDDIEDELARRGIVEKKILSEVKVDKGREVQYVKSLMEGAPEGIGIKIDIVDNKDETITIIKYEEKPLHFTNRPLARFAHEWMKRRVPADRKRVEELIKLAGALSEKLGGLTSPPQTRTMGGVGGELPRRV